MKRLAAYLTVIVFALGMLVLPALHRITGCDVRNSPGDTCAICKLSHMPMEGVPTQVVCVNLAFHSHVLVVPPPTADHAAPPRDAKQPRAPPVQG